jgi:hypothetical protein
MGLFDKFSKDSVTLGCILFYTTALVVTLIFNRDHVNIIIDKVIVNNDIIEETSSIVNNDIIIEDNSKNNDTTSNTSDTSNTTTTPDISPVNTTTPNISPVITTTTSTKSIYYLSGFIDILKQGIPVYRIKSHRKKKKIIIMNEITEKISIRATNFLSSMKNIKEFSIENIDSIEKNEKNDNGFSLMVSDGTMVSKYELLTDSKSQCEYIFNGLLALKDHQQLERETATLPEASTLLVAKEY